MISKALYAFEYGTKYVRNHPQIFFALLLIIALPLAFLYSGDQFLEAGKTNQERLQKDRIGILHDSFASLLKATNFNPTVLDEQIKEITALNPDILKFRVAKFEDGAVVPFAAMNDNVVAVPESEITPYQNATVRPDESIIFEYYQDAVRYWQAFRAVYDDSGSVYFIFTETTLASVDQLLREKERSAYYTLAFIYLFLFVIAYWHIRVTDYRYLYKQAEEANKTKDKFINMVAHELRAPLTAIRGYTSLVQESNEIHGTNKLSLERIQDSSERLLTIINDLLDVARIQSGKLRIEKNKSDMSEIVSAVVFELSALAQEKNIALTGINIDTPHYANIDKMRMQQAVTNLVSNAIKYTKEGTIELSLEEKSTFIELRVKDTGMGISAEDQKKLFAPFFRVESSSVSEITGTGLGMWITRQLIELMGAEIGVESIKGIGTHVVVKVPTADKP